MRDGGDAGLSNIFRYRNSQGNIHWNGQGVLRNNQIDVEFFDKFIQVVFDMDGQLIDSFGERAVPDSDAKRVVMNFPYFRMGKMGFFNQIGSLRRPVQLTGKIIACPKKNKVNLRVEG